MASDVVPSAETRRPQRRVRWTLVLVVLAFLAAGGYVLALWLGSGKSFSQFVAGGSSPDLEGAVGWVNTPEPIKPQDLRGKVVILDFWTEGCINCIHMIPTLSRIEEKYPNEVVVIGVHSPKFDNDRDSRSIEQAVRRYGIRHPVVNDADKVLLQRYEVRRWPSMVMIDPDGRPSQTFGGEISFEQLNKRVEQIVQAHRQKHALNERPLPFQEARAREADRPLSFPGKVLADEAGNRLFIADSSHHRIVITDLGGNKIAVAGTGQPGKADGPFEQARFHEPQGMALRGETLYIADRGNHLVRSLDLKARTVRTEAGTGFRESGQRPGGPALKTGLDSPWDVLVRGDTLYIAMAGDHQVWALDLAAREVEPFVGSGVEMLLNGKKNSSGFAQPSGLAADRGNLYVADSEASAVRAVRLDEGRVQVSTLVGKDLFTFGDVDGPPDQARLQHPLGLACHDGKLYVADTYNGKVKVIDLGTRVCTTLPVGQGAGPAFNEPGGLSYAGGKVYVADTNAHRIRVVDLASRALSTLELKGVEAPKPVR